MKNLVLIDFTEESLHALAYAIDFTKSIDGKLEMINVTDQRDFDLNYSRLADLQSRYSTQDFNIEFRALLGELEYDLPDYIGDQKVGFVFCGTHNLRFMEYIFSSRILKLMNHIDANFLFIPKTLESFRPIKHIMAPILLDKHSLQKLEAIRYLSLMLKFKLTLVTYKSTSKSEAHEINERLFMATKILEKTNLEFTVDYVGKSETELKSMIIEYAVESKVDLISLVNFTKLGFININSKAFMDVLIRNEYEIPVMATQVKEVVSYGGHNISGGV